MGERSRILTHRYTTAVFLLCCTLACVSTERQIPWTEAAHPPRSVPTPRSVAGGIEKERIWDRTLLSGTSDAQSTKQEDAKSVEVGLRSLFYTLPRPTRRNRGVALINKSQGRRT